eukprot:TRINITY_DN24331_c0_g2_i1.p1 TRINITY_DN24331_c0_g2~~TRINITY_DN24331_c0_g2_i1.p1  ORF type:complete len:176 (-),score=27.88 TRINITY_DN24331_c0_g2_i1:56-532(-)
MQPLLWAAKRCPGAAIAVFVPQLVGSQHQKSWHPILCETQHIRGILKDGGRVRSILDEIAYLQQSGGRNKRNESQEERLERMKLTRSAAATNICWIVDDLISYKVKKASLDKAVLDSVLARHQAVKDAAKACAQSTSDDNLAPLESAVAALLEIYDSE